MYPKNPIEVRATYYTSHVGPRTADGSKIDPRKLKEGEIRWVALSRDLLRGGFKFGDTIFVECEHHFFRGKWVVKDKMGGKAKGGIDFLLHHKPNHIPPRIVKIMKYERNLHH